MEIYLKEKIGSPELFSGRKRELTHFLKWIEKNLEGVPGPVCRGYRGDGGGTRCRKNL